MADVGLEAIEGQDDAPAGLREALEAEGIVQREGHQFVIPLQEMGDRPWGHCHAVLDQGLMDFRDTPVMAVALLSNEGHAIKAKFMFGECQASLLFRPIWLAPLRTSGVEAAPNLEREPQDRFQGGDGTVVMVGGPHHLTTGWALAQKRHQSLRFGGDRSRSCSCHSGYLHELIYSWDRYQLSPTLVHFAILEKNSPLVRDGAQPCGRHRHANIQTGRC